MASRAEIIARMNYSGFVAEFGDGFKAGLREILGTALTKDLTTTDWYELFDEKRVCEFRWYLRCERRERAENSAPAVRRRILAAVERIEAAYPEIVEIDCTDRFWGELAGKHAAIRWLEEPDREFADRSFPDLDT